MLRRSRIRQYTLLRYDFDQNRYVEYAAPDAEQVPDPEARVDDDSDDEQLLHHNGAQHNILDDLDGPEQRD